MTPEISHVFELADASERARDVVVLANEAQSAALAKRFDVTQISGFVANLVVAPHAQGYLVTGTAQGDVQQPCGITGKRVETRPVADINLLLWTAEVDADLELLEEAYGVHEIDPIADTSFDVGELAAQYFGLAIEPFVRAEGADLDAILPQEKPNPFSVLAQLKDKA